MGYDTVETNTYVVVGHGVDVSYAVSGDGESVEFQFDGPRGFGMLPTSDALQRCHTALGAALSDLDPDEAPQ